MVHTRRRSAWAVVLVGLLLWAWCPLALAQSQPPQPSPPTQGAGEPLSIEQVIGRWRAPDGGMVVTFVTGDGATSGSLEMHSARRVWKGRMVADDDGTLARLTYRPTAAEMNAGIPLWAREQVEGNLEWRLDVRSIAPPHAPRLALLWHRPRVAWTEDAGKPAEIEDPAEPLRFEVHYQPTLKITQLGAARVAVYPADTKDDQALAWPEPLSGVMQHEPFVIAVHLPERLARSVGSELAVTVRGVGGQAGSETVTLTADKGHRGTVTYAIRDGLVLGDCANRARYAPPFLSTDWMSYYLQAPQTRCIDLGLADSDIVEVAYGEALHTLQYHGNWMAAAQAAHRGRMARYRVLFNEILRSDKPRSAKDAAVRVLRMIQNYDSLMRLDGLTDLHRVAIGEIYLGGARGFASYMRPTRPHVPDIDPGAGLLFYTSEDVAVMRRFYDPTIDHGSSTVWADTARILGSEDLGRRAAAATALAPNVVWQWCAGPPERRASPLDSREVQLERLIELNCLEQQAIHTAVANVSRQAFNDLSKAFFKGANTVLYEVAVGFTLAGDIYTLFTGYTIHGTRATATEKFMAGVGAGLELSVPAAVLYDLSRSLRLVRHVPSAGPLWGARLVREARRVRSRAPPVPQSKLERFLFGHDFTPQGIVPRATGAAASVGVGSGAAAGGSRLARSLDEAEGLHDTLSAAQRQSLVRHASPASASARLDDLPRGADQVAVMLRLPNPRNAPAPNMLALQTALLDDWGNSASLIGFRGTGATSQADNVIFAPTTHPARFDTVAGNYAIWRATGRELSEAQGAQQMRRVLEDFLIDRPALRDRAGAFGITVPMPPRLQNRRLRALGLEVSTIDPAQAPAVNLIDLKAVRDRGWMTQVRVNAGQNRRTVVIEDILLDAGGLPAKVRVFDPRYGAMVDVDPGVFFRAVDRSGNGSPYRLMRATDPDRAVGLDEFGFKGTPPRISRWSGDIETSRTARPNSVFRFTTADGDTMTVRLGARPGEGAANEVYELPDFPDQVARVSKAQAGNLDVELDLFGRAVLENPRINRDILDSPQQRGVVRRADGGLVEIIDRFEGRQASDVLASQPNGLMTRGQALAYEAATRELNRLGYVWTDGHAANFALVRRPGHDRWKVVIFDPGGIIAVRAPESRRPFIARRMQRALREPGDDILALHASAGEAVSLRQHGSAFMREFQSYIDYDRMGLTDTSLPVTPRLALNDPLVRRASSLTPGELLRAMRGR